MTDNDLENIYKAAVGVSHYAGLRAVYDAGYYQGAGSNLATNAGDPSLSQVAPTTDASDTAITTP